MCIAEWMTDFIGVVRKEKRSEVAFKGFRRQVQGADGTEWEQ